MEKQDNKIISQKLDSLDSLPEGYHPNLDSKWMLLQESLESPYKKIIPIYWRWISVAAILLLICGLSFLHFNSDKKEFAHSVKTSDTFPSSKENNIISPVDNKYISEKNITHYVKNYPSVIIKENKSLPVTDEIINIDEPEKLTAGITEEPEIKIIPEQEPVKKKKSRYIQIDIDDQLFPTAQNTENNNGNHSFSFKIGLAKNTFQSSSTDDNNSPVKIHRNF